MDTILAKDKKALQADRYTRLRGMIHRAGMALDFAAFWTDAERASERQMFSEADKVYEADKAALRKALLSMDEKSRAAWFESFGLAADTDIVKYLPESPAVP